MGRFNLPPLGERKRKLVYAQSLRTARKLDHLAFGRAGAVTVDAHLSFQASMPGPGICDDIGVDLL